MKIVAAVKRFIAFPLVSELLSRGIVFSVWIKNKQVRQRVSFLELLGYCFAVPSFLQARKYFSYSHSKEDFNYYKIEGQKKFFNYPKCLSVTDLCYLIYEHFHKKGWHYYEIPQTQVKEGDTIVDCGAAEGLFSFKNQTCASRLYLFEPLPIFVKSLKFLFKDSPHVFVIEEAASDKEEVIYLKPNSVGSVCQKEADDNCLKIKASTIDSHFYDKGIKVDYIKADVEGFEENVVLGALKTILRDKPKMALATYHQGQDHRRIIDIVRAQVPQYRFFEKGIGGRNGSPVILHMWVDK
ncbi:MAG: FkbM family methyltransferase [Candidatus Omnitrophota bacterium]